MTFQGSHFHPRNRFINPKNIFEYSEEDQKLISQKKRMESRYTTTSFDHFLRYLLLSKFLSPNGILFKDISAASPEFIKQLLLLERDTVTTIEIDNDLSLHLPLGILQYELHNLNKFTLDYIKQRTGLDQLNIFDYYNYIDNEFMKSLNYIVNEESMTRATLRKSRVPLIKMDESYIKIEKPMTAPVSKKEVLLVKKQSKEEILKARMKEEEEEEEDDVSENDFSTEITKVEPKEEPKKETKEDLKQIAVTNTNSEETIAPIIPGVVKKNVVPRKSPSYIPLLYKEVDMLEVKSNTLREIREKRRQEILRNRRLKSLEEHKKEDLENINTEEK